MTLTTQELLDFRADIGDETEPYAFEDSDIQRLYVRADSSYNKALLLGIEQLLMNAAKFYNYVSGHTRQEQEKIFENLLRMRDVFKEKANRSTQVNIVGIAVVPPETTKAAPFDPSQDGLNA